MSLTLFFLVAASLLAVTWSFCFVGCILPTSGLPGGPSTPYSNVVLNNKNIIAYWPLNDASGSGTLITSGSLTNSSNFGTAADVSKHGHDGTYIAPPAYPNPPIANSETISGTPTVAPSGSSIVPGDTGSGDQVAKPGSVALGGGYVSIPWGMQNPPSLAQFTVESWIAPSWMMNETGITHVLFGALAVDASGNATGFVIGVDNSVNPGSNLLQIVWGNGTPTTQTFTSTQVIIDPSMTTYVGVSGDATAGGGTFNFFANGVDGSQMVDSVAGTGYVPIDPTLQQVMFFIGAGRNAQAPRTNANDPNGAPEFPFVGQMQSAALYGVMFGTNDFSSNFSAGSGG